MSEAHSSSTAVAQTPTTDDLATYAPEWMDHVDFSVLTETAEVSHRGYVVEPSRFAAQLENRLTLDRQRGEIPTEAHHTLAVRHAFELIADNRPKWFNGTNALSVSELIETYYDGVIDPTPQSFDLTERDDRKQVVVPVAAIVINAVLNQQTDDRQKEVAEARSDLYQSVLQISHDHDLSREEVEATLHNALSTMEEHDLFDE